jgi:hypothetical protein
MVTPMSCWSAIASFLIRPAIGRTPLPSMKAGKLGLLSLSLMACAASTPPLHAQTSPSATNPSTTAPATPSTDVPAPAAANSSPSAVPESPIPGFGSGTAAFCQDPGPSQYRPADAFGRGSSSSRQWNSSVVDPFQPRSSFGGYSGAHGGVGFTGGSGFGMGRQGSSSFNQMGGSGMGGHSGGLAPLFPAGSAFSPSGAAPLTLPPLNQLMRGSFTLPSSPNLGTFRLSYQDALRPGMNLGDLARPSTSLMFSTSDLGNGMFLSARTSYGHSMAGAPAAGLGSSTSGDAKHSGPSVALKLSF